LLEEFPEAEYQTRILDLDEYQNGVILILPASNREYSRRGCRREMKILVLAPPIGTAGGIQNYTATYVRALREVTGEKNMRMIAVPAEPSAS